MRVCYRKKPLIVKPMADRSIYYIPLKLCLFAMLNIQDSENDDEKNYRLLDYNKVELLLRGHIV